MTQKSCDNCALRYVRVPVVRPPVFISGKEVYLCSSCLEASKSSTLAVEDWIADQAEIARIRDSETAAAESDYQKRRRAWHEFDAANPDVYSEFVRYSNEMRHARDTCSAWLVVNVMRWNRMIKTTGADFKISNDFIGFYARKYMSEDPTARGRFFTIKPMRGEDFQKTRRACGFAMATA